MLYDAYQAQQDLFAPVRAGADLFKTAFGDTRLGPAGNYMFRSLAAAAEIVSRSHLIHDRPAYRIEQALDGWKKVWAFLEKHLAA